LNGVRGSLSEGTDDRRESMGDRVTTTRVVYLMRGLPSCGKSFRARELAGSHGIVCETDQFFETEVGGSIEFHYDATKMQEARDWNFKRFHNAVDANASPIVVDRGNGLNLETQRYVRHAVSSGYVVELAEPLSPWWQEIVVLLKYKPYTQPVLDDWADRLAVLNRSTHRTPEKTIRRWMKHWDSSVTVEAILNYRGVETPEPKCPREAGLRV